MHGRVVASEQEETSRSITQISVPLIQLSDAVLRSNGLRFQNDATFGAQSCADFASKHTGVSLPNARFLCRWSTKHGDGGAVRASCVHTPPHMCADRGAAHPAGRRGGRFGLLEQGRLCWWRGHAVALWAMEFKGKSPADLHLRDCSYSLISSIATTRLLREPQDSESRQQPVV